MASHISGDSGSEIPPAAPFPWMILRMVIALRGRPHKQVPFEVSGHSSSPVGAFERLLPERPAGPCIHVDYLTNCSGPNPFTNTPYSLIRISLISHLRSNP